MNDSRHAAEPVIVADHLSRSFGTHRAVDDLTLTVDAGEVVGILGPNGAGKTTTIRMLAGLIAPTSGTATVAGCDVTDPAAARRLRAKVGILPEEPGLYTDLSAVTTLEFYARLYGVPKSERAGRIEALLRRLDLWDRRDDPAGTFSKGMRQRLALARAMIHEPPVLFLDEPTANLDPEAAAVVRGVLDELRQAGHAILLNTHQLVEAERMCDRVAILRTRLVAIGTPGELRGSAQTRTVAVELDVVTDAALAAARGVAAQGRDVTVDGRTLAVPLDDIDRGTPDLVAALVGAGARIRRVTPGEGSLESTYLRLVGTSDSTTTTEGAAS